MANTKPMICGNSPITIPDDDCDCCDVLSVKVERLEETAEDHEERITANTENFDNYYDKDNIDALLEQIQSAGILVVNELPATGEPNTFYYVKNENDEYEQWIYQEGQWISLGTSSIDLTGYVTTTGNITEYNEKTMIVDGENGDETITFLGNGTPNTVDLTDFVTTADIQTLINQAMANYCPYGVGDIMFTADLTNPSTRYPNTQWQQIEGRFILGASSTYNLNATGGSKDATLVQHSHTVSGQTSSDTHSHGAYGTSTHFLYRNENAGTQTRHYVDGTGSTYYSWVSTNAGGLASATVTNADTHYHSLEASVTSTGVSGTDKNMPPYIVKYIWQRTA